MPSKSTWMLIVATVLAFGLPVQGQAQTQARGPVQLPDGQGKEIVQIACAVCHSLNNVVNSGHTPAEWRTTMAMMLNVGAAVPKDKVDMVTNYLIKNFPEKPAPHAEIIPGNVKVTFQEWKLPTPGTRPHDPLAAPDGTIWYSGQMANVLGHVDPKTGHITEYHLPTPDSGPHGLIMDKQGNIWFTANFKAYIGKFVPNTGKFTEYHLDPAARDPHTPVFDQKGIIWFTVQGANMVGRFDPKTGMAKTETVPTPKSNPYGMVVTSKGVPYFMEFGAPKIASIDPVTMAIHEYPLPNEEARPRRVAITSDDVLYYTDYRRGYLGRFDTKTNKMTKEWLSPGGPKSRPYGITIVNDIVWYSESGVKPNTLVRFDPRTEKFQTWIIPAGGGVVRNMMHFADGKLALTESGKNIVALVTVKNSANMAMGTK
ncbi:MAG TPA: cytochrome C [Candidatus Dormibacteraeota bacterium]|nr:cytochrome C [Candidatus Dormibacteraeota bacterium]